jgi:hypothetical protein
MSNPSVVSQFIQFSVLGFFRSGFGFCQAPIESYSRELEEGLADLMINGYINVSDDDHGSYFPTENGKAAFDNYFSMLEKYYRNCFNLDLVVDINKFYDRFDELCEKGFFAGKNSLFPRSCYEGITANNTNIDDVVDLRYHMAFFYNDENKKVVNDLSHVNLETLLLLINFGFAAFPCNTMSKEDIEDINLNNRDMYAMFTSENLSWHLVSSLSETEIVNEFGEPYEFNIPMMKLDWESTDLRVVNEKSGISPIFWASKMPNP